MWSLFLTAYLCLCALLVGFIIGQESIDARRDSFRFVVVVTLVLSPFLPVCLLIDQLTQLVRRPSRR